MSSYQKWQGFDVRILSSVIFLFIVSCATIPPIDQRKAWTKVEAPEEISRLAHATCFADIENFYVFSGIDEHGDGPFSNIGYTYNLSNKSWVKWPSESGPAPIQNFTSVKRGDEIYIFGGQEAGNSAGTNKFYLYSLKKNQWKTLPSANFVDGRWRSSSLVSGENFVVYGGKGAQNSLNTAAFDLAKQKWVQIETPAEVGTRVSAVVTADSDRLIIFGGFIGAKPQENAFALDLTSKRWSNIAASLLGQRVNPKFVTTDSQIYVIGGATKFDEQQFGGIFDLERDSWQAIPRIKDFVDFKGYEITHVNDEGILLWGGRYVKDNRYNDTWYFFRFASNDWIELKLENSPPGTIGGCLVSNDARDVFAMGGIMPEKGRGLHHLDGLWILPAAVRD